jgi:tetratricopeptide (TPR) repeat protein
LIIDNLDDISVADGYLPDTDKGGHAIITTRNRDPLNIPAEGFEIPMLCEDDVVELFRIRSTGNVADEYSSTERIQATELVKELGYLALAIEQVSAFIRSSVLTIAKFLRKRLLLQKPDGPYPHSVATTFLLSLDRVDIQAVKLLYLLVFLNPDGILIDFLQAGRQGLRSELQRIVEDELAFHQALEALQNYSLVALSRKNDGIVIHRVIQAVVKDSLSDTELHAYRNDVIGLCDAAFPATSVTMETRELCRKFQNQVVEAAFEAAEVQSQSASLLLQKIGSFLTADGKYADSTRLQRRSVDICRTLRGNEHLDTLTAMDNLASTYQEQGKLNEAAELQEKVLEARSRILGEKHPHTSTTMSNLATTYQEQGKLNEAAELQEKVLEAQSRILGEEHPETLTTIGNLAVTYKYLERVAEAVDLMRMSLAGSETVLGCAHPDTASRKALLDRWIGNV